MGFPDTFLWGAATSSYQIEGAAEADGKGPSIWDEYCKRKGAIWDNSSGDVACDHYHRFREDVALMKELGIKAYRFSISWPRLLPEGTGRVNPAGVQFYSELVDELLAADILPCATLYHWDMPYALFQKGGWLNPESSGWFEEYTRVAAQALGDRVKNWLTFNEPQCFIGISYVRTLQAPALPYPARDTMRMAKNVLLAHGRSVRALRELSAGCRVGLTPTGLFYYPAGDTPADIEAARTALFDVTDDWSFGVSFWSDPIFLGHFPDKLYELHGADMPEYSADDFALISQPLDFCGQNMYNSAPVRAAEDGYTVLDRPLGFAKTDIDWAVSPQTLYWTPKFLYERYKKPIWILENGMTCHDTISLDGACHDPNRIDYLHRYLRELRRAIDDGVDVQGYFLWSLLDNFEWTWGYQQRFGIVHVDFETQKRTPKDSFGWYRQVIQSNGSTL